MVSRSSADLAPGRGRRAGETGGGNGWSLVRNVLDQLGGLQRPFLEYFSNISQIFLEYFSDWWASWPRLFIAGQLGTIRGWIRWRADGWRC